MRQNVCGALIAGLLVGSLSCSGGDGTAPNVVLPPAVSRLSLSQTSLQLTVGGTVQLAVATFDASNNVLTGRTITFVSSNVSVVSVSSTGLVTALQAGTSTITVASEGVTAAATVTVTAPPPPVVARVTLTPPTLPLIVGGTGLLTAAAFDAQDNVIAGKTFAYSSSNVGVATVTQGGLVTALATGSATITATVDGVAGSSAVTVTATNTGGVAAITVTPSVATVPVGTTLQLSAVAQDAQGNTVTGQAFTYVVGNPTVATVSSQGLVSAVGLGSTTVTVSIGAVSAVASITVSSPPTGNVISVNSAITYQTISGWEGHVEIGQTECNRTAYPLYKTEVLDRLVNEVGLNRVRLEIRSGLENTVDYFAQFESGAITYNQWKTTWFLPVNDDNNPNNGNPGGFQWSWLDYNIDEVVNPLRQRLQARGEKLFVNLNFVDFGTDPKPFQMVLQPAEYAEFMLFAFQHLQSRYGWVPDAIEILLEPEHTNYYGADIGRAIVAVGNRLAAAGFTPDIIAPSTTGMSNASLYYDQAVAIAGAKPFIKELAYHRYTQVSLAALQAIAFRGQRDGIRTAQLEHIGSGIDDLIQDLTVGNVSAWQQYAFAYCGNKDNPANRGVYLQVNQTIPTAPRVNITNDSRDFRQIFLFVRAGAVRIDASSGNPGLIVPAAFRNTSGKSVVIVRALGPATFTVNGLPSGTWGVKYNTAAQYDINGSDLSVTAGTATVAIPASGVITLYQR